MRATAAFYHNFLLLFRLIIVFPVVSESSVPERLFIAGLFASGLIFPAHIVLWLSTALLFILLLCFFAAGNIGFAHTVVKGLLRLWLFIVTPSALMLLALSRLGQAAGGVLSAFRYVGILLE